MFTAKASLERDGTLVEGRQRYAGSKKAARQATALSLLAELTDLAELNGLAVPDHELDREPTASAPAGTPAPRLTANELELWLDHEVGKRELDPELLGFVQAGALSVRSLCLLLFEADPQGWAEARVVAWGRDGHRGLPPRPRLRRTAARGASPAVVAARRPEAGTPR